MDAGLLDQVFFLPIGSQQAFLPPTQGRGRGLHLCWTSSLKPPPAFFVGYAAL
jgi:hypothetical protein